MDAMRMFVMMQTAYIEGIKNAPAMKTVSRNHPFRRCAFCNGSDFVTRYEADHDSEDDYSIEELVCKDCWMPVEIPA